MMTTVDRWPAGLAVAEVDGETHADARLITNDAHLLGHGTPRRHPRDPDVMEMGEKIAVARALSDLAHILLSSAAAELGDITHQRAHLHL